MSIFSKLFSSHSHNNHNNNNFEHLKHLLKDEAEFYSDAVMFFQSQEKTIKYMMIHPHIGVVLFNYFTHSFSDLKGVTASKAENSDENADIKTQDDKSIILNRFEETFLEQIAPVHSILICPKLSESEFDALDDSFHKLIPKEFTLFSDSNNAKSLQALKQETKYDIDQIKQALFSELKVAQTNTLMSKEQQKLIHTDLSKNSCVQGLPGSGKSSVLIAKALYEKQKNPDLELIIFASRACNVHFLQSLIFNFIENSKWKINPADIKISNFESIGRRQREKEKYELIVCDNVNKGDLSNLHSLLKKDGQLLVSSNYELYDFETYSLAKSYRLSDSVSAACEGLKVDNLSKHLSFVQGNLFMNAILHLGNLLKEVEAKAITIVHYDKEESLKLQSEINNYFGELSYQYDDNDKAKENGILIYPLTHIACNYR